MGGVYQQQGVLLEKNVTTENEFSDSAVITGKFNASISGDWNATVVVQRKFKGGSDWMDVDEFTENCEQVGEEPEGEVSYRIGVATGNYTSGTIACRISQ